MKAMKTNSFGNVLASEFLKSKRNVGLIVLLCLPVVVSMYFFVSIWVDGAKHSDLVTLGTYFGVQYTRYHFNLYLFLYPLIVSFAVFSFNNIEYSNECTKLIFTLPVKKSRMYLAKVLVVFSYITCSVMLAYALFVLSINVLSFLFPEWCLNSFELRDDINILFCRTYISMLAIMMIQNCLSLLFRNFMIPVCVALVCTIVSIVASKWKWAFLFPYGGISKAIEWYYQKDLHLFHKEIIASLISIVVFYLIGAVIFKNSYKIHKNK